MKGKDMISLDGIDSVIYSSVCNRCTWFTGTQPGDRSCEAFPDGTIPDEIWLGHNDHTEPYKGDGGIRFTPNPRVIASRRDIDEDDDDGIEKAAGGGVRVYLKPGESAPSGVQVRTGPRGGKYYLSSAVTAGAQPATKTTRRRIPADYRPPERPWKMRRAPEQANWRRGEARQFAEAWRNSDDLSPFAYHEGRAIGPRVPNYTPYGGEYLPADWVIGPREEDGELSLIPWDEYQRVKAKEHGQKPKPPLRRHVNELITATGAQDWNDQESKSIYQGLDHVEVGTLFSRDGKQIFKKYGGPNYIKFDEHEIELMRDPDGAVLTHTHPSGISFSIQDLHLACNARLSEIRAIGGIYEYVFLPPPGVGQFSMDQWEDEYGGPVTRINHELQRVLQSKINDGEITVEQAQEQHFHELWTRVAAETRLRYIRRSRNPRHWTEREKINGE